MSLALPFRKIVLSERHDIYCIVDAEDYDWLTAKNWNYGWHAKTPWKYYAKRNVGAERSTVYMHREILLRVDPRPLDQLAELHGHHDNSQSLDNRRENLGWLPKAKHRGMRVKRETIPSLKAIVARLAHASASLAEVPF